LAHLGLKAAVMALVLTLVPTVGASATDMIRAETQQNQPSIRSVSTPGVAHADSFVELVGARFDLVTEVAIDSLAAEFQVIDSTRMRVRIPTQTQPGDVQVSLQGSFGRAQFNNLFEVTSRFSNPEARVTIGTFNGYAAVYTKNYLGSRMVIRIDSRERRLAPLSANYTANLTKVGAGKTVNLSIFIDSQLVQSRQLTIR